METSVQCSGWSTDGANCSIRVKSSTPNERNYCRFHQDQRLPQHRRYCDGVQLNGNNCQKTMTINSTESQKAVFCRNHKLQEQYIVHTQCFGKDTRGLRCLNQLKWEAPFNQFCREHIAQLKTFKCPIASLSNDAFTILLNKLGPLDRIAFALASKSCATLVRSWGSKRRTTLNTPEQSKMAPTMFCKRYGEEFVIDVRWTDWIHTDVRVDLGTSDARFLSPVNLLSDNGTYEISRILETSTPFEIAKASEKLEGRDPNMVLKCNCLALASSDRGSRGARTTIDPVVEVLNSGRLAQLMRTVWYLFPQHLGECMACSKVLTSQESVLWTRKYPIPTNNLKCNERKRLAELLPGNNPSTLLCGTCPYQAYFAFVEWCQTCWGPLPDSVLFRAYMKSKVRPATIKDNTETSILPKQPV